MKFWDREINQTTVVVSGIGMTTAIASDRENTWQKILQGESGIKFDSELQLPIARIENLDPSPVFASRIPSRSLYLLQKSVLEAIADACLDLPLPNCGVVIGSSRSNQRELELVLDYPDRLQNDNYWWQCQSANLSAQIANLLQTQSPVLAPMAACATANWSIAQAYELIRSGKCAMAIAAATDAALTPLTIAGFQKIGVLAPSGVYPFSHERSGFALGEGAATLVLESYQSAKQRGGKIYGKVLGWGITNDAYHATSPNPDNHMAAIALKDCLMRSQITAEQVGYINVHGTATQMNDAREADLIQRFLPNMAVSATKGATGHTLGATGMMESAFCLLALRDRLLPPCVGMQTPAFDINLISKPERSPNLEYALNFSFGFGGQNAIVAFGQCF
ncbi:beta-ketoacyl-ACP reductase [Pseudanabaena sp. FACHB-1998]|uniref:beta-ketoacyl synthase N-terminal-like domain-containing protein n=1 Tax=Pseudanabaena sp. FACHB-1998 TaxID=2692858 RepID=UPI001680D405|nr:beta-ketoacyl synthase N-terminal-like domain-containing protein [Pseudanabaena sp. FACHB-1998]MBD2176470.1 beta-ketoacyl-ACP reductase [Pseudanabaena sp. FACHB-1998]